MNLFAFLVDRVSIFLTKSDFNLTVRNPVDLTSEPGSTVLHADFLIDSCVAAGDYNVRKTDSMTTHTEDINPNVLQLSFYELDTTNGSLQFSSFGIPVSINTPAGWSYQPNCTDNLQTIPSSSNAMASAALANRYSAIVAGIVALTSLFS